MRILIAISVLLLIFAAIPSLIAFLTVKLTEREKNAAAAAKAIRETCVEPVTKVEELAKTDNTETKKKQFDVVFIPNSIPLKTRIWNSAISVLLLFYGAYGVATDHLVLPAKHGTLTLYGYAAWTMYAAMLCTVVNLISVVIDHYDKRENESKYKTITKVSQQAGWVLFFSALILGFVQNSHDLVCENRTVLSAEQATGKWSAVAFNRYCALHNPNNAKEHFLQISVIPANSNLPTSFGNAVLLNTNDVDGVYWRDDKLVVEYHRRSHVIDQKYSAPSINSNVPVHVELVNTRKE